MCKVSVIIPNYNHSRYLPQRIESVLKQTYQNFEVLIMDDFSTDNSREIILEYSNQDTRIHILFNDTNSGNTFKQWKKGINEAKGEYIWIAESDDFADTTFLEKLVPVLDENENVGVAYVQSWEINGDNDRTGSYSEWTKDLDERRWENFFINNGREELKNFFCIKNTIPNASAALIRRKSIDKAGEIETSMKLCGDKMFWTKLLLVTDIAFLPEHLNYFRTHRNNVRTKSNSRVTLIEDLQWFFFLKSNVTVPKYLLNKALAHYYRWWVSLIVARPTHIFSSDHKAVQKVAYKVDTLSPVRLFSFLFIYYFFRLKVRINKNMHYA